MATTTGDTVVSVRLDSDLVSQLDELAGEMQRSRSFLIAQAVGEFVEREYASLVAVREGEADIEAGRSIEGDQVRAWFEDLKSGRIRKTPAAGKRQSK
jgi:RHH-type rel operon transcriptional repressor/antitoxin RelB